MYKSKPKVIIVLGPTASGKSAAAIGLAKKFNGEIISADSRQIYCGMDIGTGKVVRDLASDFPISNPSASEAGFQFPDNDNILISEGIIHHAIDIVNPNDDFNVTDFKKYANVKIKEILSRGKLPIICGGTGFWISAVVDDLDFPSVPPDKKLREKLSNESSEELLIMLSKIDPQRAQTVDSKNKFRIIRAIEICKTLGKVPELKTQSQKTPLFDFLQVGIQQDKEVLKTRIKLRLDQRFENGMEKEVETLHSNGVSWERLEAFGLEYRWISRYLQNKISHEEMKIKLYFDIVHYAKRQRTWFQKDKSIVWLEEYKDIENCVSKFLD